MIAPSCATATLSDALTQAGLSTQQWTIFDSYRPKCTEFIFVCAEDAPLKARIFPQWDVLQQPLP